MTICPNCKAQNPDDNAFCHNCGKSLKAGAPAAAPAPVPASAVDLSTLKTIGQDDTRDNRWRQMNADTTLEAGTVFADRYTIESVIGRGGMGVVYRARDSIGDRPVALKLIRSDLLGGEPAVKRLIGEGVLTQDIRHKNIVNVYNVGQVDGQPFVAMEFAAGKSLREWFRQQVAARTVVPLRVAARIIAEILDGLDAAHAMGVVHRDLKPENVILTADPTDKEAPLKILDFGIARAAGQMESGTGTGLGTLGYMPPEQRTNPDAAGPSADLYSVSVMFYELLVEVLPQGHWQPPSGGRADVSPKVDELIERGLSNRPGSRPQTAKDYRQQLVDAVNTGGSNAVDQVKRFLDPTAAKNFRAKLFKQPWVKWTLIVVGVLAVIGGIMQMIQGAGEIQGGQSGGGAVVDQGGQGRQIAPASPYAALNGQWIADNGAVYTMAVSSSGTFSGSGMNGQGVASSINGQFNGANARYVWSGDGIQLQGQAQWDGSDCHVSFVTYNPDGSTNLTGKFHINHRPSEPCP